MTLSSSNQMFSSALVFFTCLSVCLCLSMSQLFGCGSVAQTVLSKGALGEPLTIHIGFTLGVMMAVYMAGGVSGKIPHTTHT